MQSIFNRDLTQLFSVFTCHLLLIKDQGLLPITLSRESTCAHIGCYKLINLCTSPRVHDAPPMLSKFCFFTWFNQTPAFSALPFLSLLCHPYGRQNRYPTSNYLLGLLPKPLFLPESELGLDIPNRFQILL